MASEVLDEMKGEISTETVPRMQVEWKIPEDILFLPRDTDHRIHSPSFDFKDAAWYLRLTFHRSDTYLGDFIDLHIVKKYPVSSRLRVIYHMWLKTTSGNKYRSFRGDHQSTDETDLDCWGKTNFLCRSNLSTYKTFLAHNGVIRVFCHFWTDTAVSSPSTSRAKFKGFRSTTTASQISENIGEISTEVAATMYVEWKVPDIPLLSEDADHRISSPSFGFKDEVWYLQATILDKNFTYYGTCGPIDIHLMRKKCDSGTLYVEYMIGIKLVDGKIYTARHNEYVFDGTIDCPLFTGLVSRLDEKVFQAPNGEATFFCCFTLESPASSNAGSKKMSEATTTTTSACFFRTSPEDLHFSSGNTAQEKTVPTVSSSSKLNWTPEKQKFPLGNLREEKAVLTLSSSSSLEWTPEKPKFSTGASKLFEDFKNLFSSGEDSDLSIKVKDTEFRVHKIILRARSSVFYSMLSHDMKEKTGGIIDITDCEPEAFKIFLLYLYNGCVENLSTDTVFDVCKAADKYGTEELKLKCKEFMLTNLSVDTVCDVIDHALQYDEEELLKTATDFFVKNFKDIILTVNWQIFMKKNTVAANELLIKASNYYVLKDE